MTWSWQSRGVEVLGVEVWVMGVMVEAGETQQPYLTGEEEVGQ